MTDTIESAAVDVALDRQGGVAVRTVTGEAETYNSSVAGVEIEAVRAGVGIGPTQVLAAIGERFTFTASKVGFPMFSGTTVPDDMIIVAYIRSATPGSRWCEIDLEPGAVVAYGPAAEHSARNLPGLDFMFAISDRQQLDEHCGQLGICLEPPGRGQVHLLARTPNIGLVGRTFSTFANAAASGEYPSTVCCDNVLRAMIHGLSEESRVRRVGSTKRIDSRYVVNACIDYARSIQRIPSTSELCLAARVSERRMREAFIVEFDVPPTQFFRILRLAEAHRRLIRGEPGLDTVTDIALQVGFEHLGRFAGHYRNVYGEVPSYTLRH